MRANSICNLTTVTLKQDVAYILFRFLCNTGSRAYIFRLWLRLPTPAKFFSRLWPPTPRKNLRLPRLRLPDSDSATLLDMVSNWCTSRVSQTEIFKNHVLKIIMIWRQSTKLLCNFSGFWKKKQRWSRGDKLRGQVQGQGPTFLGQTLSRPRTGMVEDQGPRTQFF